ncbi:MAG TPA: alpha/beta hydrolase [Burkholderiaceae bacterium]|nr:alpha/beta hydrolase [Burkholderiaceae bacterium]
MKTQRPTTLLLHSSASSARQWDRLVETLAPQFRVHAIELHGHGERAAWRGDMPLTLADEAALAVPLLEEAGGVHVIGHSYGGAVALKLAAMHPTRVRSVVVYEPVLFRLLIDDTAHSSVQDVIAVADSIREGLAAGRTHLAAQCFVDFWSGAGAWNSLPAGKQASIAARMHAVRHHFDALFDERLNCAQLAALSMPMLFVSGARTVAVTRRLAALLRVELPDAEHAVLPAMGHMGPITHAQEVNHRLVEFLQAQAETLAPA